jgi:hypothetical protein
MPVSFPAMSIRLGMVQLLFLLALSPAMMNAQNRLPVIRFDREVISMDTINEVDGYASVVFKVYNDGNAVLRLLEVKASCGCTSEEYTRDPIPPQDSGFIRITYDPVQRPGKFNKYVSVKCNDPENIERFLQIQGFVRPRPLRPEERFPHALGSLLFEEGHRTFGTLKLGEKASDTFLLFNAADQAIKLQKGPPETRQKHLKVQLIPTAIGPAQEGMLIVDYDTRKRNDFGVLFDTVYFMTNDPAGGLKSLSVSVNIKEDFSSGSRNKRNTAPRLLLNNDAFRFGSVKRGETLTTSFVLKNDGQTELIIRKVTSSCTCLKWDQFPDRIPPGESREVNLAMQTNDLSGAQHKIITLITNDPENDQVFLRFIGNVN